MAAKKPDSADRNSKGSMPTMTIVFSHVGFIATAKINKTSGMRSISSIIEWFTRGDDVLSTA
jgi:hypothetical protein